jgi:hypothetical protein
VVVNQKNSQRCAAALQFFGNDPPTWFVDRGKTASSTTSICRRWNNLKS